MEKVLVLNSDYTPINVTTVIRGFVLVSKGKAEILKASANPILSGYETHTRPLIIRLLNYVRYRVKNLRIKYESLIARNKSSTGEVDAVGDHTQAYFIIKAAQEREELMRYGDELDHKLRTCQKEIMALANTLDHLKMRNKNYRDKFIQGAEGADLEKK